MKTFKINVFIFDLLIILSLFLLVGCSEMHNTPLPQTLWQDRQAKKFVEEKKIEEALDVYSQMLESSENSAIVHGNIGATLYSLLRKEDALKSLEYALNLAIKNNDKAAEFALHYNLGVYFGKDDMEKALNHYQEALKIVPWHEETRHNIELLFENKNQENKNSDQSKSQQDSKNGQNGNDKNQKQDQNQNKDDAQKNKDSQQKEDNKENQGKDEKEKKKEKEKENNQDSDKEKENEQTPKQHAKSSPKHIPRPFKGDKLSEGDVKKILGELKNQEQKIRSNFDKKEKKDLRNEKDW